MKNNVYSFKAENAMIEALNQKKYADLNDNLKRMLRGLYPMIKEDYLIKCRKYEGFYKPDFVITCNGVDKYISMKSADAKNVHEEPISLFITFLHRMGFSKETLETVRLFQYGDGTIDGTGKRIMSWREVYYTYAERIKKANIELNQNKRILLDMMDRFLFQGVDSDAKFADAIYHGGVDEGILVRKEQFENYFLFKRWDNYDSFHIGPLIIKPHTRFVGFSSGDIKNEHLRHKVQLKWPHLKEDMAFMYKYVSGRKFR